MRLIKESTEPPAELRGPAPAAPDLPASQLADLVSALTYVLDNWPAVVRAYGNYIVPMLDMAEMIRDATKANSVRGGAARQKVSGYAEGARSAAMVLANMIARLGAAMNGKPDMALQALETSRGGSGGAASDVMNAAKQIYETLNVLRPISGPSFAPLAAAALKAGEVATPGYKRDLASGGKQVPLTPKESKAIEGAITAFQGSPLGRYNANPFGGKPQAIEAAAKLTLNAIRDLQGGADIRSLAIRLDNEIDLLIRAGHAALSAAVGLSAEPKGTALPVEVASFWSLVDALVKDSLPLLERQVPKLADALTTEKSILASVMDTKSKASPDTPSDRIMVALDAIRGIRGEISGLVDFARNARTRAVALREGGTMRTYSEFAGVTVGSVRKGGGSSAEAITVVSKNMVRLRAAASEDERAFEAAVREIHEAEGSGRFETLLEVAATEVAKQVLLEEPAEAAAPVAERADPTPGIIERIGRGFSRGVSRIAGRAGARKGRPASVQDEHADYDQHAHTTTGQRGGTFGGPGEASTTLERGGEVTGGINGWIQNYFASHRGTINLKELYAMALERFAPEIVQSEDDFIGVAGMTAQASGLGKYDRKKATVTLI
jgi:hypothetical protein